MSSDAGRSQPTGATASTNPGPITPPPRLLPRTVSALRARHYSRRTEKAYVAWIRRFILFHGKRHPDTMGAAEVTRFLSDLAELRHVSASTQNQALAALLFLHRHVLDVHLPWLDEIVRARRPDHLPVVRTRDEVARVLGKMTGVTRLMGWLMYGTGLRLLECARLRVKDVDVATNQIVVRGGKGDKDRVTLLPAIVKADLASHMSVVRRQHERDLRAEAGWVELPYAQCLSDIR